jgi:hypothetical protein
MWAAVLNAQRGESNVVLLTSLGGGAFGSDENCIYAAMRRALDMVSKADLHVKLVSYGAPLRGIAGSSMAAAVPSDEFVGFLITTEFSNVRSSQSHSTVTSPFGFAPRRILSTRHLTAQIALPGPTTIFYLLEFQRDLEIFNNVFGNLTVLDGVQMPN